jgi:hypothetical protein
MIDFEAVFCGVDDFCQVFLPTWQSLSEILCVRHHMSVRRSMSAKQDEQDEQEETGSGTTQHTQRVH